MGLSAPSFPVRSRFRVGLVRVTCRCRRCNAGNVRKLTCQNLYPHVGVLALLAGHETLRVTAGTSTRSCKYCHEFRINALKTKTGRSRLSKKVPNSPRPKKVCHVGTECSACNVLRCTSSIFMLQGNRESDCTASTRRVPARSMLSGKRLRSHVRSGTCIARTAVSDPRVSMRTRTATCNWLQVRVPPHSRVALVPVRTATHPSAPDGAKPGRIGAACGAAGSCPCRGRRLRVGTASLPRGVRCRGGLPRSSAAGRAAHSVPLCLGEGPEAARGARLWAPVRTARARALTGVGVRHSNRHTLTYIYIQIYDTHTRTHTHTHTHTHTYHV
jgi:hypothetical protein